MLNRIFLKALLVLLSREIIVVNTQRCDRSLLNLDISQESSQNNGKYTLEIDGKPDQYMPNERYTISLKLDTYKYPETTFRKFVVTAETKAFPNDAHDISYHTGQFTKGDDGLSQYSHVCENTLLESNNQPKKQVTISWTAPRPNSGCVTIKAIIIETRGRWYADDDIESDGPLTKTLCQDFNENEDTLPEVLDFCCACDEAKYEMVFEGNWIRNNHPKGFPENLFTTKFSDIIGASHKNGQEFWSIGFQSSWGLKEVAFNGSTRTIEAELMEKIKNLRTIIKAKGLAYPNMTSMSSSIFRVDNENHLVSAVTKMIPSPDWVVGVSGFELCLQNCSWKESRTVNLYPIDVGIDDALEYTGSEPTEHTYPYVSLITSSEPADARSPFYDESGEKMKPIAKLHFKLEKVYKKECDSERTVPPETQSEVKPEVEDTPYHPRQNHPRAMQPRNHRCATTGWSKWSSCSVQCGKGHMTRNVKFKYHQEPGTCDKVTKEETVECESSCEAGEEEMHVCSHVIWTEWSACNATCGKGKKIRYRIPEQENEEDEAGKLCVNQEIVECDDDEC